ncbi:enoyl-CoA hydratase [compost metagenome]
MHAAPFTTVALVRGRAVGAGADLVAACEQRWMDRHSSIAFPGAGFGLVLGSARLAGLVGTALAREWISGGAAINADAAAAAGFAGLVAQQDQPAALAALAARTRRLDRSAHAAIQAATLQGHGAIAQAQASQLADLARSAARPGLKARIVAYRASLKR